MIVIALLMMVLSCKSKKEIIDTENEKTRITETVDEHITRTVTVRPSFEFAHSQVLTVTDGVIKPVTKTYESNGMKFEFGVSEQNELNARLLASPDTIQKTIIDRKTEQQVPKETGVSNWALFAVIGTVLIILITVIIKSEKDGRTYNKN